MRFIISDSLGITLAFLLFPLVTVIPGYSIGIATNILSFNTANLKRKLVLALILSISVNPVLFYYILRFTSIGVLWIVLGMSWLIFGFAMYKLFRNAEHTALFSASSKKKTLILFGVYLVLLFMLVDLSINGQLFRNLMAYDYVKHVAVSGAISRTGVPPVNPSFFPGEELRLFYYYFWFIFPSLIEQIGSALVSPRTAVLAGIIWCPVGLVGITWLFIKQFGSAIFPEIDENIYPWGLALLAITGLDLLPVLSKIILFNVVETEGVLIPSIEWWNDQVSSWLSAVLWVPHHVAAFIASLFAFILMNEAARKGKRSRHRLVLLILVVFAFSSSLGMSVWVTIVAAGICFVWLLFLLARRNYREFKFLTIAGLMALALALPFIHDLQQANHLAASPVVPTIRSFILLDRILEGLNPLWFNLLKFLFIPVNYFFELGVFALGGLLYAMYRQQSAREFSEREWFILIMVVTSILMCTFLKANIKYNDLGWRGFMFAQIGLLLYTFPFVVKLFKKHVLNDFALCRTIRYFIASMAILGMTANAFELVVLRSYSQGIQGEHGYALREAFEWIDKNTSRHVVVQHDPSVDVEYYHALYGNRQVALSDSTLGKLYGINDSMYTALSIPVTALFTRVQSPLEMYGEAKKLNIDFVVVDRDDPVWKDQSSWVWRITPVYENGATRIYAIPDHDQ